MQQRRDPARAGPPPAANVEAPAAPPAFWGRSDAAPVGLSISQLIARGLLDARTAALLWLTLERHGSVLVAALPQRAGKTTLLGAVLDLLPASACRVHLQGTAETFAFLRKTAPAQTLLLANELSSHLPVYLWGSQAKRAFGAVADGYAIAGTLHADSADAALAVLRDECGIPAAQLERIGLIAVIAVTAEGEHVTGRRVTGVYRTLAGTAGPDTVPVVEWDPATARWHHDFAAEEAQAGPDIATRTALLADRAARGIPGPDGGTAATAGTAAGRKNGDRP